MPDVRKLTRHPGGDPLFLCIFNVCHQALREIGWNKPMFTFFQAELVSHTAASYYLDNLFVMLCLVDVTVETLLLLFISTKSTRHWKFLVVALTNDWVKSTLSFQTLNFSELNLICCFYRGMMTLKLPNQLTMKAWRLFRSRRRCLGTLMFSMRWLGLRHTPRGAWASASPPHSPVEWILSSATHWPPLPLIWSYRTTNSSPALKLAWMLLWLCNLFIDKHLTYWNITV